MDRYLVTGGAGFIGSSIVAALVARGDHVRVLDDFSTGKRENVAPWRDRIELLEGSIADLDRCREAVDGVDYVLHQAARPSVPKSIRYPRESNEANVVGSLNMLLAARDAGVRRFVYAGSSSVYGDTPTLPKVETMAPNPRSPYAVQKYAGELYARVFHETYGLETVVLRYFNVFGPRQDPASEYSAAVPKFITRCLRDEAPVIFGDGRTSRDFTYVDNVVDANLAACAADERCAGQVMNVACGERIDLLGLVEVIRRTTGSGKPPVHESERPGDVRHSLADTSRARELIGFEPAIGFEEGIRRTVDWYREQLA